MPVGVSLPDNVSMNADSQVRIPASTDSFTPSRRKEVEHDSRALSHYIQPGDCEMVLPDHTEMVGFFVFLEDAC